jgi:uncharacterized membrane protein YqhA
VVIPIVGLVFLAAALFVVGGIRLVVFAFELIVGHGGQSDQLIYEIVEFIHFFLIGTVLYITAMGLFQLFITELSLPEWLTVDDIEKLEMNLVGVVVVIIGVNFLSVIINPGDIDLLNYGAGYALPIIGLSVFIFVRSRHHVKDTTSIEENPKSKSNAQSSN